MAYGSVLEVYQASLFGMVLSSMGVGGIFKSGIPKSGKKGLLKQS